MPKKNSTTCTVRLASNVRPVTASTKSEWVSIQEAAQHFGLSYSVIWSAIRSGQLMALRIRGTYRVRLSDIIETFFY